MSSIILTGNYTTKFPLRSEIDSSTAMTGTTYALSVFDAGTTGRIRSVTRLDAGTTADVITILDSASNATALVFGLTGVAATTEAWSLGSGVAFPRGGFGVTVTSGGTAGTYAIEFEYQRSVA